MFTVCRFRVTLSLCKEQAMAAEYKTPGVYIEEIGALPPPIAGVDTAVAVFIGHTETASEAGREVKLVPTRIASPMEYTAIFGGAYQARFSLVPVSTNDADFTAGGQGYALACQKTFNLYDSIRLFYANGGGRCYVVSAGSYDDDPAHRAAALQAGLAAVHDLTGPTMLVIPEATLLDLNDYRLLRQAMLTQCADKQDRVAILDVIGTDRSFPSADRQTVAAWLHDKIADFRDGLAAAPEALKFGMAYAPFLKTSLVGAGDVSFANFDPDDRKSITAMIEGEIDRLYPARDPNAQSLKRDLRDIWEADPPTRAAFGQRLAAEVPLLTDIFAMIAAKRGTLPSSPAMAGIYTQNDAQRGVWKAPANVGLAAVTAPTMSIDDAMQENLNAPPDGLAVNAIRTFTGKGTLVWGARTLDGNSGDWRYISVRRTLIYIEQSVALALEPFVFEPNAAVTWVRVIGMIENFLQDFWRQGGLTGATPKDAFYVRCGLGTTMTAQDVLDGRMIVEIGLAPVRPAEFIVLRIGQHVLSTV
jgi:Bacteriophage tail sheath protein